MLTNVNCKDFSTEEIVVKAFKKFIESGMEKISDLPNGIPYFAKRESVSYLEDKHIMETSFSLMNVFNVEFANTVAYTIPFIGLPWSNLDGINIPNALQQDLIKAQFEDFFELEKEIPILKEGFKNSFPELFSLMIKQKEKLIEKDLFLLYLPCFNVKPDYQISFLDYIIISTMRTFFFIEKKSLIVKIDQDLTELFKDLKVLNILSLNVECIDSNKDRTYLLVSLNSN